MAPTLKSQTFPGQLSGVQSRARTVLPTLRQCDIRRKRR